MRANDLALKKTCPSRRLQLVFESELSTILPYTLPNIIMNMSKIFYAILLSLNICTSEGRIGDRFECGCDKNSTTGELLESNCRIKCSIATIVGCGVMVILIITYVCIRNCLRERQTNKSYYIN